MRRWLFILLMLTLSLQSSWAVADICVCVGEASESAIVQSTDGHQAALNLGAHDDGPDATEGVCEPQCSACHLGSLQLTQTASVLPVQLLRQRPVQPPEGPRQSHIPDELERPNWLLAA
jgi:hypothetical protein